MPLWPIIVNNGCCPLVGFHSDGILIKLVRDVAIMDWPNFFGPCNMKYWHVECNHNFPILYKVSPKFFWQNSLIFFIEKNGWERQFSGESAIEQACFPAKVYILHLLQYNFNLLNLLQNVLYLKGSHSSFFYIESSWRCFVYFNFQFWAKLWANGASNSFIWYISDQDGVFFLSTV